MSETHLSPLFSTVEILSLIGLVFLGGFLFRLARNLPDWVAGLALYLRGHVRPGDRVEIESDRGLFVGASLTEFRLRTDDGHVIIRPWSRLRNGLQIRAPQADLEASEPRTKRFAELERALAIVPVDLRVPLDLEVPPTPSRRAEIVTRVTLCPYRVWTRPARVELDLEKRSRVWIHLSIWNERSRALVEDYLERVLRSEAVNTDGR